MTLELFYGNILSFWGIFTKFGHIFITHGEKHKNTPFQRQYFIRLYTGRHFYVL